MSYKDYTKKLKKEAKKLNRKTTKKSEEPNENVNVSFDADIFCECMRKQKNKYYRYVKTRAISNIREMFKTSAEMFPDNNAFMQKFDPKGKFQKITYRHALDDMNGLGASLKDLGLLGKRVALVGPNSYQWAISYLATVSGLGIIVPLDKELDPKDLEELIKTAGAEAIIYSGKFDKAFSEMKEKDSCPIKILINMDAEKHPDKANDKYSWWELVSEGRNKILKGKTSYLNLPIDNEAMSVLLFTSGTSGSIKGVMLSHKNIVTDLMMSSTVIQQRPDDIFFSVLPVHHTYECTGGFLMALYHGSCIAYCQGLKYIVKNMKEVRPTVMLTVPAILESVQRRIIKNVEKRVKTSYFMAGLKISMKARKVGIELSDKLFGEVKESLGGRLRVTICGGAPVDPGTLRFMRSLGILAVQGYGLTETSPMVALNPEFKMRDDSAGLILPNMEVKVENPDEDGNGELCFKGDNVMIGYYQDEESTDEVIKDGWFYSGDLGYVDKKGFIYLTGRKKNVIIAKNGKNVFPEEIEQLLKEIRFIEESMVWGENSTKDTIIVATLLLNEEEIEYELGVDYTQEEVEELLWNDIDVINKRLPAYKKIVRIHIRKEPFIKTTTNKIKRFLDENK